MNSYSAERALTVADSIETTRALVDGHGRNIFVSPDGNRYVVVLVRGDIRRNGNWLDILSGRLESLVVAQRPSVRAHLFMSSLGTQFGFGTTMLTFSAYANRVQWISDDAVAFLWGDENNISQVFVVNVDSGQLRKLTHHPTDVTGYDVRSDGTVLYSAIARHSRAKSDDLLRKGYAVSNKDLFSALAGDADGYGYLDWLENAEIFVAASVQSEPMRITVNETPILTLPPQVIRFSPDKRFAILDAPAKYIRDDWHRYLDDTFQRALVNLQKEAAKQGANRLLKQLYIIDLANATSRPMWSAPNSAYTDVEWSPNGTSVIVGPTFLPIGEATAAGLTGGAVAVVNVASGSISPIPLPDTISRGAVEFRWLDKNNIQLTQGTKEYGFSRKDGAWRLKPLTTPGAEHKLARVRIEFREDLNTPPALFAVDTVSHRNRIAFDLNPSLRGEFSLGHVEEVSWKAADGREWSGLLYYPVGYSMGRKYPLVVQTHGRAPVTKFSLYGIAKGTGPGTPVFAAQALANRGILVLQVEDKSLPGEFGTPAEPEVYVSGYEAGIAHLVSLDLVDAGKVGIAGYSRTGWYVLHALTHSSLPYAAAVVCDPTDPSYIWSAAVGWWPEIEEETGAPPFGNGLKTWLERSPGFRADRVHAPLQMQSDAFGLPSIILYWEMYSRLRSLGRPVELVMPPDSEHSSHAMQNPAQLLASEQGAVDWFDFWLNGREDPDSSKRDQYARWEKMCDMQIAADPAHPTFCVGTHH